MRNIGAAALLTALAMAGGSGIGLGASIADGPRLRSMGGHRPKERGPKSNTARERVPKMLRQYAKRYANLGPDGVLQMHAKHPVPHIDHARDEMSRRHGRAMLKILKKERAARTAGAAR